MDNNLKMVGGGLAVVMLLGGISLSSSIPSDNEIADQVANALKPVTDSVANLEGRLGDISGEINSLSEQMSVKASQEDISLLQEGIGTLSTSAARQEDISDLQSMVNAVAESAISAADLSALSDRLDNVAANTGSQEDVATLQTMLQEMAANAVNAADLSALSDRLDNVAANTGSREDVTALQTTLQEMAANAVSAADLSALSDRLDAVAAETGSLGDALNALQSDLTDQIATAAALVTATGSRDAAEPTGVPGFLPGQTASFADGKLRVFISRLDTDSRSARIAINGNVLQTITVGNARMLNVGRDYCQLGLEAVSASGAVLEAICGDELPAPQGLSAGETALFEDGAARVFISRVNDDGARLALNGELTNVALGRSAPFAAGEQRCRAALDAVDRGHAQISVLCGDAVNVSEPITAGSTVTLADGAARVFLAGVIDNAARFAVNGVDVQTGPVGHAVPTGEGCAVTLEDIIENTASFSYACTP